MVQEVVKLGERPESGLAKYAVESPAKHAVSIEHAQGVGVIGVGPITGQIDKIEVEYDGQVVTEVPEGENFKLAITYRAQNPGVPWNDWWTITMTAMSTNKTIKGYEHAWIYGESSVGPVIDRIEPLGPMPDHDITLRVKLWGNQDYVVSLPIAPPEADW